MQVGPSLPCSKHQTGQEVTLVLCLVISVNLGKGIGYKFAKVKQLIPSAFCRKQARISLKRIYCVLGKLNWSQWLSQGRCWVLLHLHSCHITMSCQQITGLGTMSLPTWWDVLYHWELHAMVSTETGWRDGMHLAHALSSLVSHLQSSLLFHKWHIWHVKSLSNGNAAWEELYLPLQLQLSGSPGVELPWFWLAGVQGDESTCISP